MSNSLRKFLNATKDIMVLALEWWLYYYDFGLQRAVFMFVSTSFWFFYITFFFF